MSRRRRIHNDPWQLLPGSEARYDKPLIALGRRKQSGWLCFAQSRGVASDVFEDGTNHTKIRDSVSRWSIHSADSDWCGLQSSRGSACGRVVQGAGTTIVETQA